MQDPMVIDLDSATNSALESIDIMVSFEREALGPLCKTIAFLRSDMEALDKIMQTCSQILELVDETTGDDVRGTRARNAAIWAASEQEELMTDLKHLN